MHVGLGLQFANLDNLVSDDEIYQRELDLAARAEDAGFDSVFVSEHHFSDYQLTSEQMMTLAWIAARTSRIKLGSFVTVLPWHDPVRVAESFLVLDQLSNGRSVLGLGRGLGRVEFDGFRLEMSESRRRFTEYTEAILESLETGFIEHDGELYQQPRTPLRPRPMSSFKGRTFASAVSPASIELMAKLGVGIMVIAQKPWPAAVEELQAYRERFVELNDEQPPKPILVVVAAVSKDDEMVTKMREVYLQRWARSTVEHYEFDNVGFAEIEGYEYYSALANNIAKHGLDQFNGFLADLQVWGKPDQVTEKLLEYVKMCDAGGLVVPLSFGGMSTQESKDCFELFAKEVLPELKKHDAGGDLGVRYDASSPALKATV